MSIDTKSKYTLVEIGKLKPGDLFKASKEIEDPTYRVSNMTLIGQPDFVIGEGVETGVRLGWKKDVPVYVKEGAAHE